MSAVPLPFGTQLSSNVYPRDKLKAAQPIPGGFRCTRDEESANQLFLNLTLDGAIVWMKVRE